MKIPYKVIDGIVYVDARVEVTEHFLNNTPTFDSNGEEGYFIMDHVRSGKPTRVFGDVALVFLEPEKKEEKESTPEEWNNIIKTFRATPKVFVHSNVTLLIKLGFQKRNECSWYHPLFGMDSEENWMHFDPNTDDIQHVIPKMYHYGYNKGRQNLRYDFKKLLDIPLH
jgi:hypothetical protein